MLDPNLMPANALEEDPPTTARVLQHFLTKLLETEELLQDWHNVTLSTRKILNRIILD